MQIKLKKILCLITAVCLMCTVLTTAFAENTDSADAEQIEIMLEKAAILKTIGLLSYDISA